MKLIIDISEEAKRHIDTFKGKFLCGDGFDFIEAIQNGTPLDTVKAEIKKNILDEPIENGTNAEMACYNGGLLKCLEIIDNIGKAESEDI